MPKITGIFDSFEKLDEIPIEDIKRWVKEPLPQFFLENYVANRIFYPQAAPVSDLEMKIDLAIMREALTRNNSFYVARENKILIPEIFVERIPDPTKLAWVFIDAYKPKDIITLYQISEKDEVLGSVVSPVYSAPDDITVTIEGKPYIVKYGSFLIIPLNLRHFHVSFTSKNAKVLGKNEIVFEAEGGRIGLVIDGRGK